MATVLCLLTGRWLGVVLARRLLRVVWSGWWLVQVLSTAATNLESSTYFNLCGGGGGVIQGVVDEDQETEGPDLGPSGHTARKQQEGRPGTMETNGHAAPRVESASHDSMNPRSPIDAALLKTL